MNNFYRVAVWFVTTMISISGHATWKAQSFYTSSKFWAVS